MLDTITREHLLNLAVNFVPMFIIAFFAVLFLVFQPWTGELLPSVVSLGLLVVPLLVMALVTYLALKHVEVGGPEIGEGAHAGEEGSEP